MKMVGILLDDDVDDDYDVDNWKILLKKVYISINIQAIQNPT